MPNAARARRWRWSVCGWEKVAGKAKKLCEDCADRAREEGEIAEQSEAVVQNMMGFKGRR